MQLGFDLKVARTKKSNRIKWSYSMSQVLGQCNYKFYSAYYGGNGKFKNDDPFKDELHNLKRLSNRYMVIGDAIHVSIEQFFKKRAEGKPWPLKTAIWFAHTLLEKSIEYSKSFIVGQEEEEYPPGVIKEINQKGWDAEKIKIDGKRQISTCLTNFYEGPPFKLLVEESSTAADCYFEKKMAIPLTDGIIVGGKVDFAFTRSGFTKIVDWKTGKEDYEETNLQLLVYALWAIRELGISIDKIEIYKGYLLTGKLDQLLITSDQIDRVEATVYQQIEKIKKAERHALNSNTTFFTKRKEELICDLCPFECHCYK